MKKIKQMLKWLGLSVLGIILIAVVILWIIGYPKPGTIVTAENVPKIPWSYIIKNINTARDVYKYPTFSAWLPGQEGAIVKANSGFMKHDLFYQRSLEVEPELLEGFLRRYGWYHVNPDSVNPYIVFNMDFEGDEQYQLYMYDFTTKVYNNITSLPGRIWDYGFHSNGGNVFFINSVEKDGVPIHHIYKINPKDTLSLELLFSSEEYYSPVDWHPTEDLILLIHTFKWGEEKIKIYDVKKDRFLLLFPDQNENDVKYDNTEWSENGQYIFYLSDEGSDFMHLHRYEFASGRDSVLTSDIPWSVVDYILLHDGQRVLVNINENGFSKLYLCDFINGTRQPITDLPWGTYSMIEHPNKNIIGLNIYQAYDKIMMYEINLSTGERLEWKDPRQDDEDKIYLKPTVINYPTFDSLNGEPRLISANLYKFDSKESGQRPVYISLHGGPPAQSLPNYKLESRFLEDGIVIIEPNFRGSTGYGTSFERLDNGQKREDAVKDIGALLDWIKAQPDLDEKRVAVVGGSYGGYMVLASLVHYSDRLKCGLDQFGLSDWVTAIANSEPDAIEGRRNEFGDERVPKWRSFLNSISPINNAEKIEAPLFVYQGLRDSRVSPEQSRKIVEAVRANGHEVWYIEASNEGHGLWDPMNLLYVGNAWYLFIEKYLLNE